MEYKYRPKDFYLKEKHMFIPIIEVMNGMGGVARVAEIDDALAITLKVPEDELMKPWKANGTLFKYISAWARTALKKAGKIENIGRGIWRVVGSEDGDIITLTTKDEISVKQELHVLNKNQESEENELSDSDKMLGHLRAMDPYKFENICKQLLIKIGFKHVSVTPGSNDKGIDGYAIFEHNPVVSMKFAFQAKRYSETTKITSSTIRDFRGSIINRAEKGVILTTGFATSEAKKEILDGPRNDITIIEGNELAELFLTHQIGVRVKTEISFK